MRYVDAPNRHDEAMTPITRFSFQKPTYAHHEEGFGWLAQDGRHCGIRIDGEFLVGQFELPDHSFLLLTHEDYPGDSATHLTLLDRSLRVLARKRMTAPHRWYEKTQPYLDQAHQPEGDWTLLARQLDESSWSCRVIVRPNEPGFLTRRLTVEHLGVKP